jgi:hypothetical protein
MAKSKKEFGFIHPSQVYLDDQSWKKILKVLCPTLACGTAWRGGRQGRRMKSDQRIKHNGKMIEWQNNQKNYFVVNDFVFLAPAWPGWAVGHLRHWARLAAHARHTPAPAAAGISESADLAPKACTSRMCCRDDCGRSGRFCSFCKGRFGRGQGSWHDILEKVKNLSHCEERSDEAIP